MSPARAFAGIVLALLLAACARPAPQSPSSADVEGAATKAPAPTVLSPAASTASAGTPASAASPPMQRVSGPAQPTGLLQAHLWRLTGARDAQGRRIASLLDKPGLAISMQFDAKRLRIDNTCNRMGGDYRYVQVDQLEVLALQQTRATCADARLMAAEADMARMVVAASMLSVEQPAMRLRLTTLGGEQLFFQGIALPARR